MSISNLPHSQFPSHSEKPDPFPERARFQTYWESLQGAQSHEEWERLLDQGLELGEILVRRVEHHPLFDVDGLDDACEVWVVATREVLRFWEQVDPDALRQVPLRSVFDSVRQSAWRASREYPRIPWTVPFRKDPFCGTFLWD